MASIGWQCKMTLLQGSRRRLLSTLLRQGRQGVAGASFDIASTVFTMAMRKSPGAAGVFDAAPMVQGRYDMSGTADYIQMARGNLLGNALGYFYDTFDPYQGTILLWFTPEVSSAAIGSGYTYLWYISAAYYARYNYTGNWFEYRCGDVTVTRSAAIVAGTVYHISCSWNVNNPLDGTNYIRDGLNDAYAYGGTGLTASAPDANNYSGRNAQLEGWYYIRRVLYDGTYGTPPLDGADELADIYAGGSGLDPSRVIGSWDTTFCMPTDGTPNATLVTGTGQAWSHPHGDSLPDVTFMSDGDPPGTPYAVEFNGTSTYIDCGSDASLDDIPAGGGQISVGVWFRWDDTSAAFRALVSKFTWTSEGWYVRVTNTNRVQIHVNLATTDVDALSPIDPNIRDGKWHFGAVHYNDATKTGRASLDGVWGAANVGAGAYVTEAAFGLWAGNITNSQYFNGALAWFEVWDNDHYGAGTDFIPPRAPTAAGPGNLVETWWADEGTGVTVAARVTSPNNDGTITNPDTPSWTAVWEQEGTPVIPTSLEMAEYSGVGPWVSVGSGATIDDLHLGANGFTAEGWFCLKSSAGSQVLAGKRYGWSLGVSSSGGLQAVVYYGGTNATISISNNMLDEVCHHLAMCYNENTDRKIYLFLDGILRGISDASVGAGTSDAGGLGVFFDSGWTGRTPNGHAGWQHWSDTVRYTGTTVGKKYFVPAGRSNIPGADGNSMGHWAFNDGAGTTVTDTSGNANHGTIVGTSHTWRNTTDMETESPGERAYPWGYAIGSDGANDGITIIEDQEVTAGKAYVMKAALSLGMSGRGYGFLRVYDNTGAANIVDFYFPRMYGQATAAAASLTDTGARWIQNLAGWIVYNVTDGSSATITSNTEQNIVGALAGGAANTWAINDYYSIMPPSNRCYGQNPWQESFVWTAPAGCTSVDVKILNAAGEGIVHIHQPEIYESRLTNGDFEAGAGVPWVPTGWTATYIAGEAIQELTTIHSGSSALEIVATAATRYLYRAPTSSTVGKFYLVGGWFTGNGAAYLSQADVNGPIMVRHSDGGHVEVGSTATTWNELLTVRRRDAGVSLPGLEMITSAAGSRYADDLYVVELDDVSLTFGPASQANSLEPAPNYIRVDGEDRGALPANGFGRSGGFTFRVVVRQDITVAGVFRGEDGVILDIHLNVNNYLYIRILNAAAQVQVLYEAAGAGVNVSNWNPGAQWEPQDELVLRLEYGAFGVRLWADGVPVINNANPCFFDAAPTTRVIGPGWGGGSPDIVFGEP